MKELLDHGAIKFPKLLPFQEEFLKMAESQMGVPKEMLKEKKHSTAEEVKAIELSQFQSIAPYHMAPPPIGSHIALNIVTFDQYHGNGWKANLVTGEYEPTQP